MWIIGTCVSALIIAWLTHWIYRWRNPKCNGVLPPGSFGLPLIGETLQLMVPSYSLDLLPFLKKRIQWYGKTFRTSVAGRAIVVSADPEFCHFVLQQDGKLFDSWALDTFAKLFAQEGEASTNIPNVHKYIRSMVLKHFGMEVLREKLLLLMEEASRVTIKSWLGQESVDVRYTTTIMAIEFGAKQLFSYDPTQSSEKLGDLYFAFVQGLMSIPLNIPGTAHYKCMKNHKKALSIIREIVKARVSSPETPYNDYLSRIMTDMSTEKFLTEDSVVQLIFGLLFVSSDSISTTLTLALMFLEENPKALQEITEEHENIMKNREVSDSSITWEEYKSMPFTLHVIHESLRLGNVSPGLLRRTKSDVEWNGYTIPARWGVLIATSAFHLDPETYKDPATFDPWRWKDCESDAMRKNFMPFGWGMKQCAGAEYARVFLATFMHVLVTKYRYIKVKRGEIRRNPILNLGEGLHIKVMEK
ncbi:cucurbitadienol 11-hydroxylase-like [Syzygium oleosum]|uniref:cucurbitadienol 11-hydroxylase-like n=1 Tax=Syzygium oleosum TaxID=219896 RepID=UPI0011D225FB|nr:cucurbitadienol 11-hydroxylase-like [Syzygium oleosum]